MHAYRMIETKVELYKGLRDSVPNSPSLFGDKLEMMQ